MKRISFILLFLILTLFVVFGEGNSEVTVLANDEKAERLSYAKYYGIDEDIKKVNTPITLEEYRNNILYSVLTGDLTPEIKFSSREIGEKLNDQLNYQYEKDKSGFDIMTDIYVEAFAYYYNGGFSYHEREDNMGNFYLERAVESENSLPNEKVFFSRQTQAIESLIELSQSFHKQGLISDEMSQYDILEFYLDYVDHATHDLPYSNNDFSIMAIIESKSKNSINLISYLNILLRIEGMQVQSLLVNNSLCSRVLADGYIYYVDDFHLFSKNSATIKPYYPILFDGENKDVTLKTKRTESRYLTSSKTTPDVFTEPWYEQYARTKITTLDLWGLSEELGPATLDYDEAIELAEKAPEEIAARIKTVADVFIYMWSVGFDYNSNGKHPDNNCWFNGKACLINNRECCCTSPAALGSFLLDGDYDAVGVFRYKGEGATHWNSWVYTKGKYYAIDFEDVMYDSILNFRKKYFIMDNLDQYPIMCNSYGVSDKTEAVLAFATAGQLYPTNSYEFPPEAEGKVQVLYWRPDNKNHLTYSNTFCVCEYGWDEQKEKHPDIPTTAKTRSTINTANPIYTQEDVEVLIEYLNIMKGLPLRCFENIPITATYK